MRRNNFSKPLRQIWLIYFIIITFIILAASFPLSKAISDKFILKLADKISGNLITIFITQNLQILAFNDLYNMELNMRRLLLPDALTYIAISKNDKIILSVSDEAFSKKIFDDIVNSGSSNKFFKIKKDNFFFNLKEFASPNGNSYKCTVFYNMKDFELLFDSMIILMMFAIFLMVAGLAIAAIILSKKILRPLELLNIEIIEVSEEKKEFPKLFDYKSFEIETLHGNISNMLTRIYSLQEDLERQSKLAAIGQTAAMLAHDIRKPFAMIKSMLAMFEVFKNSPSELNRGRLDIDRAIKQVETMISDIMDFSREVKLSTRPVSVTGMLDFSIRQTGQGFKEFDITIQSKIQHSLKPFADEERLTRVFANIISNAIEAITIIGKKNEGTLFLTSSDKIKNGKNMVEIIIGNDGPPFTKETEAKLFDSFFTSGKPKGTGLGLASARKIITLHKGEIVGKNREGDMGVEFVITLPASNEPDSNDSELLPGNIKEIFVIPAEKDQIEIETMITRLFEQNRLFKIVLLEDEALYRAAIRNIIRSSETLHKMINLYEVNKVDDAIKLIEKEQITHAIVDIDLGEVKNGFDFLKEAKERFPEFSSLVHSNRCIEEDKKKALNLGASGFVPKPLNLEFFVTFLAGKSLDKKNQDKKVILFADDMFLMREGMKMNINALAPDADFYCFNDAESLLAKLKEHGSCSIVISDQNMGNGMTGLELTAEIRKSRISCKIYIVANEDKCYFEERAINAGADGYFMSPISKIDLEKLLK